MDRKMSGQGKTVEEHAVPQQKKEPASQEKVTPEVAVAPVFLVTQATHVDIPDICGLFKRVWDEFKGKVPQEFEKIWQPSPLEFTSLMEGVTFFAAKKDKKLVGILGVSMIDGAAHIVHIAVDPDHRKNGVGHALLGAGLEWAKKSNASSVWVEPLTSFNLAIALFNKLGFTETGVFHKHLWKQDVQLMEIVF